MWLSSSAMAATNSPLLSSKPLHIFCMDNRMLGTRFFAIKGRKGSNSHRKLRGIKICHGESANESEILVKQHGDLRFYPGANVICDPKDKSLVATKSGQVIVTHETIYPKFDSPLYDVTRKGCKIVKPHFNVIIAANKMSDSSKQQEYSPGGFFNLSTVT
ncbi:MAG: 60S ribosomal protein L27, mitochondrial [Marteilia pararefringens]